MYVYVCLCIYICFRYDMLKKRIQSPKRNHYFLISAENGAPL